jgi:hypothetical protein
MNNPRASLIAGVLAAAVPVWWIALHRSEAARRLFVPDEAWPAFQYVLVPDLALALVTAALAVQLSRGRASRGLFGVVIGAWGYATVYSIAWARAVDAPVLGPATMVLALVILGVVWHGLVSARPAR